MILSAKRVYTSSRRLSPDKETQSSLPPCAAHGLKHRTAAKSLHGNWDEALLFALKVALETYRFNQTKIQECDCCIQQHLAQFESRGELTNSCQNLKTQLHRMCGADLTKIPGIKEQSAQIIISEVGLDMTKWKHRKAVLLFSGSLSK